MLKILDRYILKELIKPFSAGVAAFIVIMLSNTLFLYAEMILKSGLPANAVLTLLLYNLPAIIVVTFPVGYLFATLLVLGRIAKDSEIVALRSCGVSFTRVITPILLIALAVSYLGYLINEKVVPYTNHQSVLIARDMLTNQKLPPIKERIFTKSSDERYFYIEKVNIKKGVFEEVFVFDNTKAGYPQVINALTASREKNKWVLHDGILRKYGKEGFMNYEAKFKAMEIEFNLNNSTIFSDQKSMQEQSAGEAAKQLAEFKARGIDTRAMEVDYHLKYSLPLATFFVALIAAPIGIKFAKMGTYFGVAISIALVFVWYVTYTIGRSLGATGALQPLLAAWIQNIAFGFIGIFLLGLVNRK
ncbi:MAG: LptF/LptG family permease [Candidatus Sericytochromatia bacterium]|nr:LptF/LptG family permease [Candidatus Sericytochromatia bacterium]